MPRHKWFYFILIIISTRRHQILGLHWEKCSGSTQHWEARSPQQCSEGGGGPSEGQRQSVALQCGSILEVGSITLALQAFFQLIFKPSSDLDSKSQSNWKWNNFLFHMNLGLMWSPRKSTRATPGAQMLCLVVSPMTLMTYSFTKVWKMLLLFPLQKK